MWGGTDDLIHLLSAAPVIARGLIRGIDDETARRPPADGAWSIVEVMEHLADAEEKAIDRVRRITSEDEPVIEGYDQVALAERRGYRQMDLSAVLARFASLRAERVALLQPLTDAAWERTGRHTQEGVITLRQLTLHMARHDATHLAQIARIVASDPAPD